MINRKVNRLKYIIHCIIQSLGLSINITIVIILFLLSSCSNYADENSPTSGSLKVYYDEGLALHVKNQVATFESQYSNVSIKTHQTSENECVQALYSDSCEAIIISRLLNSQETKAFESKNYTAKYTAVAKSGVALITNSNTEIDQLSYEQIIEALTKPYSIKDSSSNATELKILFDKNNSAVLHYMIDSVLKGSKLSPNCNILNSSIESINYVAEHKNTLAFIDFAWLSDTDDSIHNANKNKVKFIAISKANANNYEYPNQSSFKLNTYPFIRTVYVIRKTGDYTLAKGFESFVAGPKGQLTFLKQGLLPTRQSERTVEIKMEAPEGQN